MLAIICNPIELIIARMDKYETIKSTGAPLNHRLLMNLLYLASYLLNQQILTWKDLGKRKIYLLIPEEISNIPNQLKSRASIHDTCANIHKDLKVGLNHAKRNLKIIT